MIKQEKGFMGLVTTTALVIILIIAATYWIKEYKDKGTNPITPGVPEASSKP